ncbi:MAG: EamA family transporter [Winogradskyella sp.]|nr:EamA family transporter [Winogradskyella sp.]
MIYLGLSILSSTLIFVVFKYVGKFNLSTLQVIVVNYITACIFGVAASNTEFYLQDIIASNWFIGAFVLGFLFISIFNLMALTAQKNGLSVASVASKMSVVIPVIFGIIIYKESLGYQKIIGVLLALVAVYLTSVTPKSEARLSRHIYLPLLLFLGSGVIDTSIKYFAPPDNIQLFSATIFGFAFVIGILVLVLKRKKQTRLKPSVILFGILLGIINYGSIYFLLKALNVQNAESSVIFTVNNVGIVALSTITGLLIFSEKISFKNWIGISLAMISILLVTTL